MCVNVSKEVIKKEERKREYQRQGNGDQVDTDREDYRDIDRFT